MALLFDKPSLRSPASFGAGFAELGGLPVIIDGRWPVSASGESIAETAQVLGRQYAAIVWRTFSQSRIEEMAAYAGACQWSTLQSAPPLSAAGRPAGRP